MHQIFTSPYKTVMVVSAITDGKTDPHTFSIHLAYAIYGLVERGYKAFIYAELGDMEQVFLSHVAQIRAAYPDKCPATVRVEPRRGLYRNDYAEGEYCADFLHFVDDDPRGPHLTDTGLNNRMAKYLADNSTAILSFGSLSGQKEKRALKSLFPFIWEDYKVQVREDLRHTPQTHKWLQVHVYEK